MAILKMNIVDELDALGIKAREIEIKEIINTLQVDKACIVQIECKETAYRTAFLGYLKRFNENSGSGYKFSIKSNGVENQLKIERIK